MGREDFEIVDEKPIGCGQFGTVFRAKRRSDGGTAALKLILRHGENGADAVTGVLRRKPSMRATKSKERSDCVPRANLSSTPMRYAAPRHHPATPRPVVTRSFSVGWDQLALASAGPPNELR